MASVFNVSPDKVSVSYTQTSSGVTVSFIIMTTQVFTPEMQLKFQTDIQEIPGFRDLFGIQSERQGNRWHCGDDEEEPREGE